MSERPTLSQSTRAAAGPQARSSGSDQKPQPNAISDPREVAALAMARMNQVNVKKEELRVAIGGLIDITQQLTRAFAAQAVAVEQLRRRVNALESAGASGPARPSDRIR